MDRLVAGRGGQAPASGGGLSVAVAMKTLSPGPTIADQPARRVIDHCVRCGHCRDLMEHTSCLFFPRLYRLHDREAGGGKPISREEMKHLFGLCNTCGICPCSPVHTWIREAKDAFIERDGLPLNVRMLEDVQLVGRIGNALPRLVNKLLGEGPLAGGVKRVLGIHPERRMPRFPLTSFDVWAKARGLHRRPDTTGRKVAYFVGCSARYMFPEVAKATVEVLEKNGVAVYIPPQKCCGMPTMLEGDRDFSFKLARYNLDELARCIEAGFDIITACPTCGYQLKSVLSEGAQYSSAYRERIKQLTREESDNVVAVSQRLEDQEKVCTGRVNRRSAHLRQPWMLVFLPWKVFRDEGYFAELDAIKRLQVANHSYDLGEYLWELHEQGELNENFGPLPAEVAYFAPCHERQQQIGEPWLKLLGLLPEMQAKRVGDAFDCCGLAGIMGFKKNFHKTSLAIGARLSRKIEAATPDRVATDCLSCQVQFRQTQAHEVSHPVELLLQAYRLASERAE
ncbi:MAG: iron-sulfur cluster-binding oxidoreductase, domain pair-containing [Proteobacteria bacterium]|nr:iron-sulfur cluster-binding oxidoreductase, domain pair-containing [Pseudomonadota bacterium]